VHTEELLPSPSPSPASSADELSLPPSSPPSDLLVQVPPPLPSHVLPLEYSPREEPPLGGSRFVRFLRRLAAAAGIAFMVGALMMITFPRYDEEVVCFAFGLGLFLLAVPLPKIPGW
jgi:hypothetical protein